MTAYNVVLGMDRVTVLVTLLQAIAENDCEETNARLLAAQLLMIIGGFDLTSVAVP